VTGVAVSDTVVVLRNTKRLVLESNPDHSIPNSSRHWFSYHGSVCHINELT